MISFAAQTTFVTPVGSYPNSTAVADITGDGNPDIITPNYSANRIEVRNGDGTGNSFTLAQTIAVGTNPTQIAAADLNGDGKPDVVVANYGVAHISVLLNSAGVLGVQTTFASVTAPLALALIDVTGDGKPDVELTSNGKVGVLLNNGSGSFSAITTFGVGANPTGVTVADFTGDSRSDIAVVNTNDNTISVLINNGSGSFGAQTTIATGTKPTGIASGDFNGDGNIDLVVVNQTDNTVGVLLGNGNGTFVAMATTAIGANGLKVVASDIDKDGKLDLVINHTGGILSVLNGNGDGTFKAPTTFTIVANSHGLTVADLSNDTKPDIVVTNIFGNEFATLVNTSTSPAPTLSSPTVPSAGNTLTATLSESGCTPASGTGGFTLSGTTATVASWAISGTTLTLTLLNEVEPGETVTYSYNHLTALPSPIVDGSSNQLADFSGVSVTNNSGVPLAPSSLVATTISSTEIDATWTNNAVSPAATGWTFQYDITSAFASPVSRNLALSPASLATQSLAPSTTYYFRVAATNAVGQSDWSNTASAVTLAVPAGGASGHGLAIGIGIGLGM